MSKYRKNSKQVPSDSQCLQNKKSRKTIADHVINVDYDQHGGRYHARKLYSSRTSKNTAIKNVNNDNKAVRTKPTSLLSTQIRTSSLESVSQSLDRLMASGKAMLETLATSGSLSRENNQSLPLLHSSDCNNGQVRLMKRNTYDLEDVANILDGNSKHSCEQYLNNVSSDLNTEGSNSFRRNTYDLDNVSTLLDQSCQSEQSLEDLLKDLAGEDVNENILIEKRKTYDLNNVSCKIDDSINSGNSLKEILLDISDESLSGKKVSNISDQQLNKRQTYDLADVSCKIDDSINSGNSLEESFLDISEGNLSRESVSNTSDQFMSQQLNKRRTYDLNDVSSNIDNSINSGNSLEESLLDISDESLIRQRDERKTYNVDDVSCEIDYSIVSGSSLEQSLLDISDVSTSSLNEKPKRYHAEKEIDNQVKNESSLEENMVPCVSNDGRALSSVDEKRKTYDLSAVSSEMDKVDNSQTSLINSLLQISNDSEVLSAEEKRRTYDLLDFSLKLDGDIPCGNLSQISVLGISSEVLSNDQASNGDVDVGEKPEMVDNDDGVLKAGDRRTYDVGKMVGKLENTIVESASRNTTMLSTGTNNGHNGMVSTTMVDVGTTITDDASRTIKADEKRRTFTIETDGNDLAGNTMLPVVDHDKETTSEVEQVTSTMQINNQALNPTLKHASPVSSTNIIQTTPSACNPDTKDLALNISPGVQNYLINKLGLSEDQCREVHRRLSCDVSDVCEIISMQRQTYTLDDVAHSLDVATSQGLPITDVLDKLDTKVETEVTFPVEDADIGTDKTCDNTRRIEEVEKEPKVPEVSKQNKGISKKFISMKQRLLFSKKKTYNVNKKEVLKDNSSSLEDLCSFKLQSKKSVYKPSTKLHSFSHLLGGRGSFRRSRKGIDEAKRRTYTLESVAESLEKAQDAGESMIDALKRLSGSSQTDKLERSLLQNRETYNLDDVSTILQDASLSGIPIVDTLKKMATPEQNIKGGSNPAKKKRKAPPKPKRTFSKNKEHSEVESDSFVVEFFTSPKKGDVSEYESSFDLDDGDIKQQPLPQQSSLPSFNMNGEIIDRVEPVTRNQLFDGHSNIKEQTPIQDEPPSSNKNGEAIGQVESVARKQFIDDSNQPPIQDEPPSSNKSGIMNGQVNPVTSHQIEDNKVIHPTIPLTSDNETERRRSSDQVVCDLDILLAQLVAEKQKSKKLILVTDVEDTTKVDNKCESKMSEQRGNDNNNGEYRNLVDDNNLSCTIVDTKETESPCRERSELSNNHSSSVDFIDTLPLVVSSTDHFDDNVTIIVKPDLLSGTSIECREDLEDGVLCETRSAPIPDLVEGIKQCGLVDQVETPEIEDSQQNKQENSEVSSEVHFDKPTTLVPTDHENNCLLLEQGRLSTSNIDENYGTVLKCEQSLSMTDNEGERGVVSLSDQVPRRELSLVRNIIRQDSYTVQDNGTTSSLHNNNDDDVFEKEEKIVKKVLRQESYTIQDNNCDLGIEYMYIHLPSENDNCTTTVEQPSSDQQHGSSGGDDDDQEKSVVRPDNVSKELNLLRLKLAEKQRDIEAQKQREKEHQEEERKRLGQNVFWFAVGKEKQRNTATTASVPPVESTLYNKTVSPTHTIPDVKHRVLPSYDSNLETGPSVQDSPSHVVPHAASEPLRDEPCSIEHLPVKPVVDNGPSPSGILPSPEQELPPSMEKLHLKSKNNNFSGSTGNLATQVSSNERSATLPRQSSERLVHEFRLSRQTPGSLDSLLTNVQTLQKSEEDARHQDKQLASVMNYKSRMNVPLTYTSKQEHSGGAYMVANTTDQTTQHSRDSGYVSHGAVGTMSVVQDEELSPMDFSQMSGIPGSIPQQAATSPTRKCWDTTTTDSGQPQIAVSASNYHLLENNDITTKKESSAKHHQGPDNTIKHFNTKEICEDEDKITISPQASEEHEISVNDGKETPKKGLSLFIGDETTATENGLTPEQLKKKQKFLKNRQQKLEEEKMKKEVLMEKKRKKEERMNEIQVRREREEQSRQVKLQEKREQAEQAKMERQKYEQKKKDNIPKTHYMVDGSSHYVNTVGGYHSNLTEYHTGGYHLPMSGNHYGVPQAPDNHHFNHTTPDVVPHGPPQATATTTGFSGFTGVQSYVKPSGKSNRKLIINAISHVCLPGAVNKDTKDKCLQAMTESSAQHFLILFRDGLKFRGLYSLDMENNQVLKVHGIGPRSVSEKMIQYLYKYNSGGKEFTKIPAKTFSLSVDGFTLQKTCWQSTANKNSVPSKTLSNYKPHNSRTSTR